MNTGKTNSAENQSALFFENMKWMTSNEAARYLRVSVAQLRNMVYRGQIRSYKLQRNLRFLRSDLDRVLKPSNQWRF